MKSSNLDLDLEKISHKHVPTATQPSLQTKLSGRQFLLNYPRNTLFWRLRSQLTVFAVGFVSKLFVKVLHRTEVLNHSTLNAVLEQARRENRGIVTVMNHVSILDDPLVWGATLKLSTLAQPNKMRWTLGAKDICFRNWFESMFFSLGQVLSVKRFGRGPDQPAIDAAVELVSQGRWVHIYPEGFVHQPYEPYHETLRYFHWGVSRLVLESGPEPPLILPIYGKGLQNIFPEDKVKRTFGYRTKDPIVYAIGKPLDSGAITEFRNRFQKLVAESDTSKISPEIKQLRSEVASFIRRAVVSTKRYCSEVMENDMDPQLEDPKFWRTQTLIKLKGKSMGEKLKKGLNVTLEKLDYRGKQPKR